MCYIFINDVNCETRTVFEKRTLIPQFAARWCWRMTQAHGYFNILSRHLNYYICRCDVLKSMEVDMALICIPAVSGVKPSNFTDDGLSHHFLWTVIFALFNDKGKLKMYNRTDYLERVIRENFLQKLLLRFITRVRSWCLNLPIVHLFKYVRYSHNYVALNINCGGIIVQRLLHKSLESGNRVVIRLHVMRNLVERI